MIPLAFAGQAFTWLTKKGGWKILVAIGVFLLIMWNINLHKSNNEKDAVIEKQEMEYTQNTRALLSEMETVKNKVGNLEANNEVYIATQEDLMRLNSDLADEISKVKGEVISVIKSQVQSAIDSLKLKNELNIYNDTTFGLAFNETIADSGFRYTIKGESKFGASIINNKISIVPGLTEITENSFDIGLTYGFKEEADHYKVFATSVSPFVKINELEGALIINKEPDVKRVKPLIVVGPSIGWSYMPMPKTFKGESVDGTHGFTFGLTATLNLFGIKYR